METKETRSKNVKIRVTPTEKEIMEKEAKKMGINISEAVRHALFDKESSSSYSSAIQSNLIKNKMMNRIQSMDIPKTAKDKIIKEMGTIE